MGPNVFSAPSPSLGAHFVSMLLDSHEACFSNLEHSVVTCFIVTAVCTRCAVASILELSRIKFNDCK